VNLFLPPTFSDEGRTLDARKLWAVLISLLATVTALYVPLMFVVPQDRARFIDYLAALDGMNIGLLVLNRFGRTFVAAGLLIISLVAAASISAWTAGGVHAPGMMVYLLVIGIAGILRGAWAAALTGAAAGALSLLLLMAERAGALPVPTVHPTATSTWMLLAIVMAEFVVVQAVVGWVVRRAEAQALASAASQQQTEEARRESEEKFAMVFRASPDAIVISDLETGEIIEANASYEKLFGHSRTELIGRTTLELGIFEDPSERRRLVEAMKATGAIRDWEMVTLSRKRERIPILFSGELIDMGGRTRMVSVIHNVTKLKQAENRERRSRDEFTRRLLASQETERRRIAGELHDSLGQNLILIKNRAQIALEMAGASSVAGEQFKNLQDMAAQALAEVRQISHDLRPYQLDQLGLTRALESMIDGAAQSSQFPIERKLDPVDDLFTPDAATHLYRVAQESISNILKHANARKVKIGVERDVRDMRLKIEDDGRGFIVAPAQSDLPMGGLGLSGIAERVRILGGTLRIESAPGQGTRIEVVIPHSGWPVPSG